MIKKRNGKLSELVSMLNDKEPVSGELISKTLDISRAMVWKKINLLRKHGFEIEGVPSVGYKINKKPDGINIELISGSLQTKNLGRSLYFFDSTGSTHAVAKKYADEGAVDGTTVVARTQTASKGRLGRNWESPDGGLWLSLVLHPKMPLGEINKLGLIVALSSAKTLNEYTADAGIKWPNDIIVNNKKIGGVLMQASGEPDSVSYVVLSVGLNINFSGAQISEMAPNAVTLYDITGKTVDLNKFCADFLLWLENYYLSFKAGRWETIYSEIREFDRLSGRHVSILHGEKNINGIYNEINNDGSLNLISPDGKPVNIPFGEIIKVDYQ